jgi:hypothetical protein
VNSLRAHKAFLIFSALLAGAAAAAGCGGSSSRNVDDGDQAGAGADAGAGSGGQGGSSNGGSSVGGSSVGGSSVGGSSVGGSSVGGMATGGMSTGGIAGTFGGSGGAGGICSLPLVSGNCNAYFPSFGFSTTDGNCQPFVYGGCGGNENRFETLAECEATCGGSLSACPVRPLRGFACMEENQVCTYDTDNCLCAPKAQFSCTKIDPECMFPPPDAGVSEIVVVAYQRCVCDFGTWACQYVTGR